MLERRADMSMYIHGAIVVAMVWVVMTTASVTMTVVPVVMPIGLVAMTMVVITGCSFFQTIEHVRGVHP